MTNQEMQYRNAAPCADYLAWAKECSRVRVQGKLEVKITKQPRVTVQRQPTISTAEGYDTVMEIDY